MDPTTFRIMMCSSNETEQVDPEPVDCGPMPRTYCLTNPDTSKCRDWAICMGIL